jgi:hypothetical protein
MTHYSLQQWTKALTLLSVIFFVICISWGALLPELGLKEFHMNAMRITYPGFTGVNISSFIIGFLESIAYGLILGSAIASSLNIFAKR